MDLQSKVTTLVQAALEDDSFFIVDINVAGSEEGMKKISILVDSDTSINIDECARISRKVSNQLEEDDIITSAFIIEVSSPGLDRPFVFPRQYKKNIGKKIEVTLKDGKVKTGKLEALHPDFITLGEEVPNKANKKKIDVLSINITFAEIAKTIKVVSFK